MDDVIGSGGQLGSFEAVFSPLDATGRPASSGTAPPAAIDPEVAKAWEAYDIRLVLERNWPVLGPRLKGKIHVITGGLDTFYLEGAVKLLERIALETWQRRRRRDHSRPGSRAACSMPSSPAGSIAR